MPQDRKVRVLIDEEKISRRNAEIAREIALKDPKNLLVVAVLKGSFMFAADLMRALHHVGMMPQVEFMHLSSYRDATISSGQVVILKDVESDVRDRDVILIDDILESGRTLAFAKDLLAARGARARRRVDQTEHGMSTATPLQALLAAATVGTERMPGGRPNVEGAIGALLDRLHADEDPAARLLRQAGVLAVCARAGLVDAEATPVLNPAPDETQAPLQDAPVLAALAWTLRDGTWWRWAGPEVTRVAELQQSWARSQLLMGTEPGTTKVLEGAQAAQVYFFRGEAWSNAQSTGDVTPPPTSPPTPAAAGPALEKLPSGVR